MVQPFVLDRLPGTTPTTHHPPWWVVGRAFGACCFAGNSAQITNRLGHGFVLQVPFIR